MYPRRCNVWRHDSGTHFSLALTLFVRARHRPFTVCVHSAGSCATWLSLWLLKICVEMAYSKLYTECKFNVRGVNACEKKPCHLSLICDSLFSWLLSHLYAYKTQAQLTRPHKWGPRTSLNVWCQLGQTTQLKGSSTILLPGRPLIHLELPSSLDLCTITSSNCTF